MEQDRYPCLCGQDWSVLQRGEREGGGGREREGGEGEGGREGREGGRRGREGGRGKCDSQTKLYNIVLHLGCVPRPFPPPHLTRK